MAVLQVVILLTGLLLGACSTAPYDRPAEPIFRHPPLAPKSTAPAPAPTPSDADTRKRAGAFYKDDGPSEATPTGLDDIPDATPRAEALRAASNRPYTVLGNSFTPLTQIQPFSQTGIGSWYGKKFHGAKTSSGERYDMFAMSAAHPTLPIPSYARVTNLENGRSVVVRINDRGPFLHSRIIDLSYTAAWKLGYAKQGSARLQVDAIVPDELESLIASKPSIQATEPPTENSAAANSLPPLAASSPPTGATETPPGVFLQLGAFSSSLNAENFRDYVQSELKWLRQSVLTRFIGDKYRLQVGPFESRRDAQSVADRITSTLRVKPFLVER